MIERVVPKDDAEAAEHVVAEVGVEVYLGLKTRRDDAHTPALVVYENIECFDSFLEYYTVHREELGAGCGQVNRHCRSENV